MAQITQNNILRKINDIFAVDLQNHIIDTRNMSDTGQVLNASNYSEIMNGTFNPYQLMPLGGQQTGGASPNGLSRVFSLLGSRIGPGKSLLGGNFDLGKITQLPGKIRATHLWGDPTKPETLGPTVAQGANTLNALYQGGTALKGIYDNINSDTDLRSLKDDINLELASNPMYDTYLDAADEKLIRQVKNGSLTNNWGGAMSGAIQGIPKAALSAALGYLTGGVGGAAIGGIGSLVNSGISGYGRENEQASGKLQGLYDKLRRAGEDYRTMRRPAGIRQAGLSDRYFNQLY